MGRWEDRTVRGWDCGRVGLWESDRVHGKIGEWW